MFTIHNSFSATMKNQRNNLLLAAAVTALALGSTTASAQQYIAEEVYEKHNQEQVTQTAGENRSDNVDDKSSKEKEVRNTGGHNAAYFGATIDTII